MFVGEAIGTDDTLAATEKSVNRRPNVLLQGVEEAVPWDRREHTDCARNCRMLSTFCARRLIGSDRLQSSCSDVLRSEQYVGDLGLPGQESRSIARESRRRMTGREGATREMQTELVTAVPGSRVMGMDTEVELVHLWCCKAGCY
jgi:hypothetical protein